MIVTGLEGPRVCSCLYFSLFLFVTHPVTSNGAIITEALNVKIRGFIILQKLNWSRHIITVPTTAGQRLEILRGETHLLTSQILPPISKVHVRIVMEYSALVWMGAETKTPRKQLDTI